MSADSGAISILILLDLSAAFNTVSLSILLNRMEKFLGISGTALMWYILPDRPLSKESHRILFWTKFYSAFTCCLLDTSLGNMGQDFIVMQMIHKFI